MSKERFDLSWWHSRSFDLEEHGKGGRGGGAISPFMEPSTSTSRSAALLSLCLIGVHVHVRRPITNMAFSSPLSLTTPPLDSAQSTEHERYFDRARSRRSFRVAFPRTKKDSFKRFYSISGPGLLFAKGPRRLPLSVRRRLMEIVRVSHAKHKLGFKAAEDYPNRAQT